MMLGEAAAAAASISIDEGAAVQKINREKLAEKLAVPENQPKQNKDVAE